MARPRKTPPQARGERKHTTLPLTGSQIVRSGNSSAHLYAEFKSRHQSCDPHLSRFGHATRAGALGNRMQRFAGGGASQDAQGLGPAFPATILIPHPDHHRREPVDKEDHRGCFKGRTRLQERTVHSLALESGDAGWQPRPFECHKRHPEERERKGREEPRQVRAGHAIRSER